MFSGRRPFSATTSSSGYECGRCFKRNNARFFSYTLLIKQPNRPRFSVEHPIHQNVFTPKPETLPFDSNGNFRQAFVRLIELNQSEPDQTEAGKSATEKRRAWADLSAGDFFPLS